MINIGLDPIKKITAKSVYPFTPLTELPGTLQRDKSVADLKLTPITQSSRVTPISQDVPKKQSIWDVFGTLLKQKTDADKQLVGTIKSVASGIKEADIEEIVTNTVGAIKDPIQRKELGQNIKEGLVEGWHALRSSTKKFVADTIFAKTKSGAFKEIKDNLLEQAKTSKEKVINLAGVQIQDPVKFVRALEDPQWIAKNFAKNIPNMAFSMGIAIPAGIVGGPVGAGVAAFMVGGTIEASYAYDSAIDFGADPETAKKTALIVGVINGALESVPMGSLFGRIKKTAGGKLFMNSVTKNLVKGILAQGAEEGVTEGIQEIVSNAAARAYDENRDLFQGVDESVFFGTLMGLVTGGVGEVIAGNVPVPPIGLTLEDVTKRQGQSQVNKELMPIKDGKNSDSYYLYNDVDKKYEIVSGAKKAGMPYGVDAFISKNPSGNGWSVTEAKSGMLITTGDTGTTQNSAIKNATENLVRLGETKIKELITRASEYNGLSPRYLTEESNVETITDAMPEEKIVDQSEDPSIIPEKSAEEDAIKRIENFKSKIADRTKALTAEKSGVDLDTLYGELNEIQKKITKNAIPSENETLLIEEEALSNVIAEMEESAPREEIKKAISKLTEEGASGLAIPGGDIVMNYENIAKVTPESILALTPKEKVNWVKQHEYAHQAMSRLGPEDIKALQDAYNTDKAGLTQEFDESIPSAYSSFLIRPDYLKKNAPNVYGWFKKNYLKFAKAAGRTTKKDDGGLSTEQSFAREARKYKKLDEFLNNQYKVYRGELSVQPKAEGIYANAKPFTTNPVTAKIYAGKNGKMTEYYIDPDAKIVDGKTLANKGIRGDAAQIKWAKENGYDAIDKNYLKLGIQATNNPKLRATEDEVKVISQSILKTESQLTDIWNKENGAITTVEEGTKKEIVPETKVADTTAKDVKVGDTITLQSKSGRTDTIKVTKITDKQYIGIGKDNTSMGLPLGFAKDKWSVIEKPMQVPVKTMQTPTKTAPEAEIRPVETLSTENGVTPNPVNVKAGGVPKERALTEIRGEAFILKGVPETKGMKSETRLRREVARILKERDYDKIVGSVKSAKEILDRRRLFIRAVQKQFGISDTDLKSITKRDIRLMTNVEFKEFIDQIRIKAEEFDTRRQAMNELEAQIREKELDIEPLRQAMKFPPISQMSMSQLREFDNTLEPYNKGDVFLSKRKLETIERTELDGIKTYREARERLAKKLGVRPEDLNNIKISEFDRFKGESGLAEKDPFFRMMVEETAKLRLIRDAEFLEMEQELNSLARKLKTTLVQKLVPQQKNIRAWFEATDKSTVSLTKEEAAVVEFMQGEWVKARDYLIKMKAMNRGMKSENYFTHIRRGILETVKEDGIVQAAKELFNQYILDEQNFDILDTQTGEVLAMDKFFRFAMKRTGQLSPTENIIGAFKTYMRTFKKKQALDEIVPLIDIYAHALTPKGTTKEGLLLHGNLVRFVKEWLNTQKGRRITLVAKQGGKIDWILRSLRTLTTLMDIGLNIPVSVATQVGEQAITYQLLGGARYAKAKLMALTPKGKRITNKYRNIIGKNPWTELIEPMKNVGDRLSDGIFALFKDANVRRNRNFLLGSLTKEEWSTETVSPERLGHLRTEMSRYGVVDGAKSIVGATPEAGVVTQYKTWALPILGSTLRNIKYLSKYIGTFGKSEKFRGKRAFREFVRLAEFIGGVLVIKAIMSPDEDDDSMIGKIKQRAYQEATTLIQAIDPKLFLGVPRLLSWLNDLGSAISSIVKLERYEQSRFGEYEEGELKGVRRLEQMFTPRAIKQFDEEQQKQIEDINKQILKEIESGELTVATAKEKYLNEVKKLETSQRDKRFKLPLDEYRADILRRIENKEISVVDAKAEFEKYIEKKPDEFKSKDEKSFIQKVILYAKAIGTDPVTAFIFMFTGERIRKIEGGAIIVERMPVEESQAVKKERGATKEMILDHTVPLQLGGSNSESNLKLVSVEEWEKYTMIENYLGDKLREGLIDKKEAQRLIREFKEGKIKAEDIIK